MGCRCDSTKEPNIGEYQFNEELNISSNSILLKNIRNSTKSNLKEIEIIQNKFIEEINEKEDYKILNSIDIKEYLTYECLQAFEIFSNQNYKFKEIFDNNYSEDFELNIPLHEENDNKDEKHNEIKEESENGNEMKEESEKESENEIKEESQNDIEIKDENGNEIKDKIEKEIKNKSENENEINGEKDSKYNNNSIIENCKIFKMPPIKYLKNDSIYEGEFFFDPNKNQFNFAGEGIILTSNKEFIQIKNQPKQCECIKNGRIFYPNGDIFMGMITKEEPYSKIKGILFENINGNYDNFIKSTNFNKDFPYIVKHFNNGDIYEGESIFRENKFVFSGKGQLIKKDKNTIYKGNFSGNLYNGKGKLFKPLGGLSQVYNIEENIGKTIITNWINGKPNGEGIIKEKYSNKEESKNTTCAFRFGKIIKYISCLVKEKRQLNEKVYDFLNIWEISSFVNNFKTKSFYNYLKKNNNFNWNKIKIYRALIKNDIGNYKKDIFNNDLFKLKIENYNEIFKNILENKRYFLPFVCYRTEGGEIEQRYRAFNIFNPEQKKIYSTNYLTHKNKNITINSIFNRNMFEEYHKNEENIYDLQDEYIYNLMNWATLYKPFYKKFEKHYPVRNISEDIIEYNDYILNDDIIGNINNILCSIEYITIFIPNKNNDYSVLINPCYFLAVYIGIKNNNNKSPMENEIENENVIDTSSINFIDINDDEIKENNYNLKLIRKKYDSYIINEKENKDYEYIEFDTNKQKQCQYKILSLIKINEKNELDQPYDINLKKFYHIGNQINVKLINQLNIYNRNEKGYSIDFGTINFYGDVIYLKE